MSVPVALVGHSKAPPSLGHAAPHELGVGVCGDRALCFCGWALDVGRSPGLPQIGTPWLHLPAPAPPRGGAYHPGLGIPGWASVCDFWGGGPETWPLPWASPWSVHCVGPREGRVWAFWGVKFCSPSKYPKPDMWPHQREWEGCCDRPARVWATDMLPVSAWLPVTGKVALGGDYSPEGLPRKLGPQRQPGLGVLT